MIANDGENRVKRIEVIRLTRRFGAVTAVDDVTFDVYPGEIVGLIGANGTGKSTVLRVAAGYLSPTLGSVFINGRDIVKDSLQARQNLGYMPEQPAMYRDMRVYYYLKYRARLKGLRGRELRKRVLSMLTFCDLEKVADDCIADMSRGYRQRIGLADVLINDPPVLILDEPCMGLDPEQLERLERILSKSGNQRAVLLASHDLAGVERLCDRALIMHEGRIVAADAPKRLIESRRPPSLFIMQARENIDTFLRTCRCLEGVLDVSVQSGHPWCSLRITTDPGKNETGNVLLESAIRSGCIIQEFRPEHEGLRKIFAAITANPPNRENQ